MKLSICSFWPYSSALDSLFLIWGLLCSRNLRDALPCSSRRSGGPELSCNRVALDTPLGFKEAMDADLAILSWKNWSYALFVQRR